MMTSAIHHLHAAPTSGPEKTIDGLSFVFTQILGMDRFYQNLTIGGGDFFRINDLGIEVRDGCGQFVGGHLLNINL